MATRRDSRLETRDARKKLAARHQPHWRTIHRGLAVGYRKGPTGGVWSVRFLGPDGRYKFAALGSADDHAPANGKSVLDYRQAHALALSRATEAAHQPVEDIRLGPCLVDDAINDYLAWFKTHRKSYAETETAIKAHIRPKFGKRLVSELTTREIRAWHEKLAATDDPEKARARKATANRILTILKAALNFAWREGRVESNGAWARVKGFHNVDAAKIRYLTTAEAKRLINACDPDFRLLVQAALLSGCRYGELIALTVGDYSPDSKTIYIRESKSGRPRHVPLTDEGVKLFKRLVAGRPAAELMFDHATPTWEQGPDGKMVPTTVRIPWAKSHAFRPMRDACERAKIDPPIGFHVLRHSFASALAMAGVPLQVVARALGHAGTGTTEKHYAHLSPDHVAEQIRANLPKLDIKVDGKVKGIR